MYPKKVVFMTIRNSWCTSSIYTNIIIIIIYINNITITYSSTVSYININVIINIVCTLVSWSITSSNYINIIKIISYNHKPITITSHCTRSYIYINMISSKRSTGCPPSPERLIAAPRRIKAWDERQRDTVEWWVVSTGYKYEDFSSHRQPQGYGWFIALNG